MWTTPRDAEYYVLRLNAKSLGENTVILPDATVTNLGKGQCFVHFFIHLRRTCNRQLNPVGFRALANQPSVRRVSAISEAWLRK